MDGILSLSKAKFILLVVSLAAGSLISRLQYLAAVRPNYLPLELLLRILLSFLPESVDPACYTPLIKQVCSDNVKPVEELEVDLAPVEDLSEGEARYQVRRLHLLPLKDPAKPSDQSEGPLTQFLFNRARRIEAETGLLTQVPQLLVPFLDHSNHIRTWLVSTILPLLRLEYEYYPTQVRILPLEDFERLDLKLGVRTLLSKISDENHKSQSEVETVGRDMRGLVGPWVYGDMRRKRRRVINERLQNDPSILMKESSLGHVEQYDSEEEGKSWQSVWVWLMEKAQEDFMLVIRAFEQWNGPLDVDLGGYSDGHEYLNEESKSRLQQQYSRVALSSLYNTAEITDAALRGAHRILIRVAELSHLLPPLDFSVELSSLPTFERSSLAAEGLSIGFLSKEKLSEEFNPLTTPGATTLTLLHSYILSATIMLNLGFNITLRKVAELHLFGNEEIQTEELKKIIRCVITGAKKDQPDWIYIRKALVWLREWTTDSAAEGKANPERNGLGNGVFGEVARDFIEREILKSILLDSRYHLAAEIYMTAPSSQQPLSSEEVEKLVFDCAMKFYDNASNGNRTRGGVKQASDLIDAFREFFGSSTTLQCCDALLAATHALSFYSLTLNRGVPFRPVNIRVTPDPISLLGRVLDQNSRSYTKLDDLLDIGRNLIAAGQIGQSKEPDLSKLSGRERIGNTATAERRIISLAIEAALAENDFETAYSYVVNRLSQPVILSPGTRNEKEDDIPWRAAYQAGRYQSKAASRAPSTVRPELRCLEQRMELLSQALLLAPPVALPEVLAVWRRCEGNLSALSVQEAEEEERWDDRGDKKIPGGFVLETSRPRIEERIELGRGTNEEAPMGLFDVARGAAAALGKSAFPLRGAARATETGQSIAAASNPPGEHQRISSTASIDSDISIANDGEGRARKRDMVSSMVTGGLASGIGWVLGAAPAQGQPK